MKCSKCGERNYVSILAASKDRSFWGYNGEFYGEDYFPKLSSICGGDACEFTICIECGWIFELDLKELKKDVKRALKHEKKRKEKNTEQDN